MPTHSADAEVRDQPRTTAADDRCRSGVGRPHPSQGSDVCWGSHDRKRSRTCVPNATPSVPFRLPMKSTATASEGNAIGTSTAVQRSSVTPTRFHATASPRASGAHSFSAMSSLPARFLFCRRLRPATAVPVHAHRTHQVVDAFQSSSSDNLVHILIEDAESPILQEGLATRHAPTQPERPVFCWRGFTSTSWLRRPRTQIGANCCDDGSPSHGTSRSISISD